MDMNKLQFWIKKRQNVLFIGRHGVGKTACVLQAFKDACLSYLYFSASTLDPWVDLIGVPKEKRVNGKSYLDLVRPKAFADDTVEAIFIDEFGRAPKKVRNAVMELIQFKSINGKRFKHLKVVWAATNPPEEGSLYYDAEPLDPAHEDRFQVHVQVPYLPDPEYFRRKFGTKLARAAIAWWKDLPKEVKDLVSPRRLDYALHLFNNGGDLRDVLPSACNVTKLLQTIEAGPISDHLERLLRQQDANAARDFLCEPNMADLAIPQIIKSRALREYFLPKLPPERIAASLSDPKLRTEVLAKLGEEEVYQKICRDIVQAGQNPTIIQELEKEARKRPSLMTKIGLIFPLHDVIAKNKADPVAFHNFMQRHPALNTPADAQDYLPHLIGSIPEKIEKHDVTTFMARVLDILHALKLDFSAKTTPPPGLFEVVGYAFHEGEKLRQADLLSANNKSLKRISRIARQIFEMNNRLHRKRLNSGAAPFIFKIEDDKA